MNYKYLDLAKRLKALAESGIGGEKYNAQRQLERIMREHGIREEDLERPNLAVVVFQSGRSSEHKRLFFHVAVSVTGIKRQWMQNRMKSYLFSAAVTPAEEIEIRAKYDFYKKALKKQQDIFFLAFIKKNEIFAPDEVGRDIRELSERDQRKAFEALRMAQQIAKDIFHKQIGGK